VAGGGSGVFDGRAVDHISITLQTYSHVQPTMHDDAAVLVANLVLPEG
jgi:hypothetical protein